MSEFQTLMVGSMVDYQINPKTVRPAIVMAIKGEDRVDLRVFVKPDDFPEFSKEECQLGTPYREDIPYGTNPGSWNFQG